MKLKHWMGSILLVLFLAVKPAAADEISDLKAMVLQMREDYEEKIEMLEGRIQQLEQGRDRMVSERVAEIKKDLKEEIKKESINVEYAGRHNAPVGDGGVVVENPFGLSSVSLGGYADMEYHDLNNAESTFRQHRFVLNLAAQINERLRFNSEYEIEYGGPSSEGGDGEAKVEQAYIDYLINDKINLRGGAILVPFGRYNLYHDSDLQDLTLRPLVARDIVPTTWTEAGYGFFGEFDPVFGDYEDMTVKYEVYGVNGLDGGFSDTGLGGARNSLKTDNNDGKAVVGRLAVSPFLGHEIGFSGYWGEYADDGDAIKGGALDTFNTFGPFELITEYAYFDVEESPTLLTDRANFFQGAYAQLNYHFWPEFLSDTFLGRGFDNPTFTLVGRYDWARIHDDIDSGTGDNEEERYTIGLNYRPVDNFVIKFEYIFSDTDNESLEEGDGDGFVLSTSIGF
ncbi:MAG: hypothetical protein H6755_06715 [Candidatus Omnitrophica bacterium]|nr:hypothetical protein [Candidatus Omnitrophota bacterium]